MSDYHEPSHQATPLLTPSTSASASASDSDSDSPERTSSIELTHHGTANLASCIANLSNTILGTGMLAMAHAFAAGGLLLGLTTVILSGSMAYFGLTLLAHCSAHPSVPERQSSFFALASVTYPSAALFFDFAVALKCFGVAVSYLLIFGRLVPQLILSVSPKLNHTSTLLDRRLWIVLAMLLLVPLSFLRSLHSLRYTSYIALIAVIELVIVVVYKFFDRSGLDPPGEVDWIRFESGFVAAVPVYVFAYTCAQNIFSVQNELIENTKPRMKIVLSTAIGGAALIYELIGTLGYLTFGSHVSSNLIADYHHSLLITTARAAISLLVLFSYPLQLHPCRASLENILGACKLRPSITTFVSLTASLLLGTFLIAVNVSRLETVLGFVGSTGSTTISYILPGVFFLKLFANSEEHKLMRIGARVLICSGCTIMAVCLGLNISNLHRA
ncbi:hypothetical protein CROQUDRAFT_659912 [Cronartium quercuum f. sp. fusiforme G11]|uniref:Amino acid transporter transmembrane domain-containing protein n=1 Tax=Cronartium quercuum f. sp. fusiforme G11 TaxID=708437 RepID=A0A9P6NHW4_9BASI|nr:hypothetical protein CROQUDRAFT_659912 [Cronartium quercuum f. sp. fusiforme G11]